MFQSLFEAFSSMHTINLGHLHIVFDLEQYIAKIKLPGAFLIVF